MCLYLYSYTHTVLKQKLSRGSTGKRKEEGRNLAHSPRSTHGFLRHNPADPGWWCPAPASAVSPRYAFFQEERHQRLEMIHEKAPMSTMQILLQHSSEFYLRELCFWLRPIYSFFFPTNFKRSSLPTCPMFQITCICCKDWGQRKGGKLFLHTEYQTTLRAGVLDNKNWGNSLFAAGPAGQLQWDLLMAWCSSLALQFGKHSQYSESPLNEIRPVFKPIHTQEPSGIIKGMNVLFFSV